MTVEARLEKLKTEIAQANQKRLRAEMLAETALKEREEAEAQLKEEFQVSSPEEASVLLKKMEARLSEILEKAEAALKEIS